MSKRVALIVAAMVVVLAVSAALIVSFLVLVTRDTRQDIDLGDFAHASGEVSALNGYVQATEELCADATGCVQGFRAKHAAFRKFASKEEAAAFASSTRGSYLSNWVVMQYTDGSLTETDRLMIQEMVDSTGASG